MRQGRDVLWQTPEAAFDPPDFIKALCELSSHASHAGGARKSLISTPHGLGAKLPHAMAHPRIAPQNEDQDARTRS